MKIPLSWIERLIRLRLLRRPDFLVQIVPEQPFENEMRVDVIYDEVRGGYRKWIHLRCPRCGEAIQLEAAGQRNSWTISTDWLRRPTISPSIWETESCGAHFFVRKGRIIGCVDR